MVEYLSGFGMIEEIIQMESHQRGNPNVELFLKNRCHFTYLLNLIGYFTVF